MAKTKGLFQRDGIWWARKDVPKPLQGIVGQTSRQKTLETRDIKIALLRFPAIMTEFEQTLKGRGRLAGKPETVESIREAKANVVIKVDTPFYFKPEDREHVSFERVWSRLRRRHLGSPPIIDNDGSPLRA